MVKPEKVAKVKELEELVKKYPVVGLISLYKIPANSFQKIRNELGEKALIKVCKKTLISLALKNCGMEKLCEYAEGQVGLIFTEMNPFKLLFYLQKNRTPAPAKPGDIAEEDIVVPAGPTDIPPGPAISTLTKVKIPAKVEGGKIAIVKDAVVCKKGEMISEDLAAALNLLKMEPIKIGLKLLAVYADGKVYGKEDLGVTEEEIIDSLTKAYQKSFNLSIGLTYPTPQNISLLLQKAYMNAKALLENVEEVK
jgi:large subunit ribosomal protein L10